MKIGVFAYNFPHWKSMQGLVNLCSHGFTPDIVFAADWEELSVPRSKSIGQRNIFLPETHQVAQAFNIPYAVTGHNSKWCEEIIREWKLDLGIILGARILEPHIIKAFKYGIINMHPGILPENRGLDNVKWAVIKGLPIGATVHMIDEHIDRGRLMAKETINIYPEDTMTDLVVRVQNLEQKLLIKELQRGICMEAYPPIGEGTYFRAVPTELDSALDLYLESRKQGVCYDTDRVN